MDVQIAQLNAPEDFVRLLQFVNYQVTIPCSVCRRPVIRPGDEFVVITIKIPVVNPHGFIMRFVRWQLATVIMHRSCFEVQRAATRRRNGGA